jgi:V/A-type H+/Na+-transporting ATPase subunit G/H
LTVELVKAIKEAESKAEKIIRDAKQDARQLIREAESTAEIEQQEALAKAGQEAKQMIQKAEEEANAETIPLQEKQKNIISRLREDASGRLPNAVALMKEKVVKSDADY